MATFKSTSSRRTTILKEINNQHYQLTIEIRVRKLWILVERILKDNKATTIMESDLYFQNDLDDKVFSEIMRMKERDLKQFIVQSFKYNIGVLGEFE